MSALGGSMGIAARCSRWLAVCLLASTAAWAADIYEVTVQADVGAKMRDGVILVADVYRPKADGRFPVLLSRTPYDKRREAAIGVEYAKHGYVVVIQDVRGRYASHGDWYPFRHESQDGYDSVEWAAGLPYANGKVGMFGGSYVGATQLLAAIATPPHLAGIFPVITPSNYHEGWAYQGGAFEQWFNESWTTGLASDTLRRRVEDSSDPRKWSKILPLASYPLLDMGTTHGLAPYFNDWLAHPAYDDYWKAWSIEAHYDKIVVPVFTVAAWYDIFLGGSLRNFVGLRSHGGSEAALHGQRLVIEVGGHAGDGPKVGEVDFGPQSHLPEGTMLRWYDFLLKGINNGVNSEKPVRIFVMGRNEWRDEDVWPPARSQATRYYLHSGGKANSLNGDGGLTIEEPKKEKNDHFTYDPEDPVPTRGGPLCCDEERLQPGAFDQRPVETRQDVLVYSTPGFSRDVEVTGPVSAELYVKSSAPDTDFTAKLLDVWPNGFAQNLTEGILRMRYAASPEKADLIRPGKVYKINIDLWATSNVFRAGHRIRLEISSSNFPRFDRNLNTGDDQGFTVRFVKALNTVYHDHDHPSALVLPVAAAAAR
jgi:putative CocE/NonD family hydrolase